MFYQGILIKETDILPEAIVSSGKTKILKEQTALKPNKVRRFTNLYVTRGVIQRVVDGDTIVVNNEKIRLLNVDTEEISMLSWSGVDGASMKQDGVMQMFIMRTL